MLWQHRWLLTRQVRVRVPVGPLWGVMLERVTHEVRLGSGGLLNARCAGHIRLSYRWVAEFDSLIWLGDCSVAVSTPGCDPVSAGSIPVSHPPGTDALGRLKTHPGGPETRP